MDFTCIEIEGALYSPESVFSVGSFWIIPATSNAGALSLRDCKVFLVSQMSKEDLLQEVNRFIFCYQFLFLRSEVYFCCSLQQSFSTFIESGEDIHEIVDKIYKKYGTGGPLQLAFNEIGTFHTQLPDKINFVEFYSCFLKKYNEDDNFRNIIDLFLYTIGSKPKFYNNIYQKISQLQTILETIVGKPEEGKQACGKNHLKEEWKPFLTRKFGDRGFENNDIDLMVKIKTTLSRAARVKYTHFSKQLNTWQKSLEELKTGSQFMNGKSEYTTNFNDILDNTLKVKDWSSLDWDNVYNLYQVIVKRLIYSEYFIEFELPKEKE